MKNRKKEVKMREGSGSMDRKGRERGEMVKKRGVEEEERQRGDKLERS